MVWNYLPLTPWLGEQFVANKEQKGNSNDKKEAKMSLKEKREAKKSKSENKYK